MRPHGADFGAGQCPTGLDFGPILDGAGQDKDLTAFPNDRGKQQDAIKALADANKPWVLAALLNHEDADVKIRAAQALERLAEPHTVPALLAAAKANNYPGRGSESATLHMIYRGTLKSALEKITGLKLTPKGLKVIEYPQPGQGRTVTSDEHPERFPEEVDFPKVEAWLAKKYPTAAATSPSPAPSTQPAMSELAKKLIAAMPAGWELTGHGSCEAPLRWSGKAAGETLAFKHDYPKSDFPGGPAAVDLWIMPADYAGRLLRSDLLSPGGAFLAWVSDKRMVFTQSGWPQDEKARADVENVFKSLGFKQPVESVITPAATRTLRVVTTRPAGKTSLPGSDVTLADALGQSRWVAVCKAITDPSVMPHPGGGEDVAQEFRVVEVFRGPVPDAGRWMPLNYRYNEKIECPILKGERVICVGDRIGLDMFGIKALPDTPENRKAVAEPASSADLRPATGPAPSTSPEPATRPESPLEDEVLKDLGKFLAIGEQAPSLPELAAKVKPDFTFGDAGRDMMWIDRKDTVKPGFRLARALVYQPGDRSASFVLVKSLHEGGPEDDPYTLVQCSGLPTEAKLHDERPMQQDGSGDYAVVKSRGPGGAMLYEVGWQTGLESRWAKERRLFVLRSGGRWQFVGEGPAEGYDKLGYGQGAVKTVAARVEWTGQADAPVRIRFVVTDTMHEWANRDTGEGDPTKAEIRDDLDRRNDWVLEGRLPGAPRRLTDRPYMLARSGDSFGKVVRLLSYWIPLPLWSNNSSGSEAIWKRELVRLNPNLPTGDIPKGRRINLPTDAEMAAMPTPGKPATQPATAPATKPAPSGPATVSAGDPYRGAIVTAEPDKAEYFLGENVLLHWSIRNGGDQPIKIGIGGDGRTPDARRAIRFKVEAIDEQGKWAWDPYPNPDNFGGLGGDRTLEHGEQFHDDLQLMRYREAAGAGTYTIRVYHDLGWDRQDLPGTQGGDIPKVERLAPVAETKVRLVMPTEAQARQVVAEMLKLPTDANRTWGKPGKPFADFELLRYPVYLPIMKELAEKGDTRGLDAVGAMAFPEGTTALVELADNKNLAIAGKAMELLARRTPSPWHEDRPSRQAYLADRSWNDQPRGAATAQAWKLLGGTDREQIIKAARHLQSMGGRNDLPALIKVMDRVLPAFKDDPNEQAAYLRPATASGALVDAAARIIRRGGQPPASPATPGQAVAFLVGLGVKGDFRPEGWRGRAVGLIDHQIPFIRDVALRSMPLLLDDAAIAAVARAIKDDFAPVQGAACDLAGKAKSPAFRQPLMDLLASTDNEWLVRGAFLAAKECGTPLDRLLEICLARLGQDSAQISGVCYEQMVSVLQHEGGYGGTAIHDWSGVAPGLKKAWKQFIAANRDAIRAGKKYPIAKDPVVPAMVPPGMQFDRKGQPPWPENDPPISEAGKGDIDAIVNAIISKLPGDCQVTRAAAGQIPQGWNTTDRTGVLVEGVRGAKPFGIYFMPADWIGVRKPDKARPNPAGWDNNGVLQGQGYKVIIRDVDVEICAALQKMGMHPPYLYRAYDIARRTYRRWDKKLDLSARAMIDKFCKAADERNEAVRSLLDLGVPADGLLLEYAEKGAEQTRGLCLGCLPCIGGPQVKRVLMDSLTDPNAAYYAGYALRRVADANDGPKIAAVFDRIPHIEAATAAAATLAAIDYKPAAAVILERMKREKNKYYKLEFVRALATLRYKPAIPFIEKMCTEKNPDAKWLLSHGTLDALPEIALLRLTGDWGQEAEGGRLLLVAPEKVATDRTATLALLAEGCDLKYFGVFNFLWGYLTINGKTLPKVYEEMYNGPAGVPSGCVWCIPLGVRLDGPGPWKVQYHGADGLGSNTLTLAAPGLASQPAARGASTRPAGTATAPARPTSSWQSPSATAPATQPATRLAPVAATQPVTQPASSGSVTVPATGPATQPAPSGPAASGLTVGLAPQQPKVRFGDGLKIEVTLTNHGSKPIPIPLGSLRLVPSGWRSTGSGGTGLGEDIRLPAEDGVVVPAGGYVGAVVTDREHTTIELGPIDCQWRPVAGDAGIGFFKGEQEPIKVYFDVLPSQLMEAAWSARTDRDRSKLLPEIRELLTLWAKSTDSRQRRLVEKTVMFLAGAAMPLLDIAARDDDPLVRAQAIEQYSHTAWAVGNMKAKQAAATQPGHSAEIGSWVKLVPPTDEKAAAAARIRVALAGLNDSEAVVRISAVRVLTWARHGPAEQVKRLAGDPDARVRAVVQDYLSLFAGGAWSADTLVASLKDPNEAVRDKAIEALETSSEPPPPAALKAGFSASTGELARRLLALLYEQEDGNLPAALIKGFANRTEAEKIAILAAVAGHHDEATMDLAKLAMADSSPAVQRQGLFRLLPFPAGKAEAAMKEHLRTCPAELTPLAKAVGMELRQRAIFTFLANPSGWLAAAAEKKFPSANGTVPMASPDGKWVAYVETGWGRPGGSGGSGRSNLTSLVHVVSKDGKDDRIVSDMFLVGWMSDSRRIGSSRDGFAAVSDIDGNILAEFGEKLTEEGIRPGNEWAKGELREQMGVGMPHSKHVKAAGDYGEYAAFSPDGKWLGPIGHDKTFLSVAGEKTSVTGLSGADFPAAWAPDGNNVLVWGWKTAKVVNFVTRKTVAIDPVDELPSLKSWEYRECRWNPWSHDGSHLAFLRDGQVWICQSDGLQARQLTWGSRAKAFPSFSPDGKRVAYLCYQPDNRRHYPRTGPTDLWVLDLDTGIEARLTTPDIGRIHCLDWLDGQTLIFDRLDPVIRGFASTLRCVSLNEAATAHHEASTQPAGGR